MSGNSRAADSCEPNVTAEMVDGEAELLVLAICSIWNTMFNQVVDSSRQIKNAWKAAGLLTQQALNMHSYYLKHDTTYVTVKISMTSEGKIMAMNDESS